MKVPSDFALRFVLGADEVSAVDAQGDSTRPRDRATYNHREFAMTALRSLVALSVAALATAYSHVPTKLYRLGTVPR